MRRRADQPHRPERRLVSVGRPRLLRLRHRQPQRPARRHVIRRYLNELLPAADRLGISVPARWLRPYLAMRLLAVYNLTSLQPVGTALSLVCLRRNSTPAPRFPVIGQFDSR